MRSAPGEAGRIMLLADLVQWLMSSRELPLAAAVRAVAEKLEKQGAKLPIFRAQPGDYAQLTTKDNVLGERRLIQKAQTVMQKPPRLREDSWAGPLLDDCPAVPVDYPEKWSEPTPPGPEPAAVKAARYILKEWPDPWTFFERPPGAAPGAPEEPRQFMGSGYDKAAALCVPLSDARALWGFGTTAQVTPNIATFADLCAYRKTQPPPKWEDAHRALVKAEVDARGGPGAPRVTAGVAAELGITRQRLNRILAGREHTKHEHTEHKQAERSPERGKGKTDFDNLRPRYKG